jgi:hypothetical protein
MGFLFYIMAKSCNLEYNVTLSLGVALTRLVVSPRSKHGLNIASQFTCENMPYGNQHSLAIVISCVYPYLNSFGYKQVATKWQAN